jgi:hypothetical protein
MPASTLGGCHSPVTGDLRPAGQLQLRGRRGARAGHQATSAAPGRGHRLRVRGAGRAPPLASACTPRAAASGSCCSRRCSWPMFQRAWAARGPGARKGARAATSSGSGPGGGRLCAGHHGRLRPAGWSVAGLGQRHPGPGRRGILALLADTMFPEAFEHGGRWVALATAIGFACAFLLSELTGSA